MSGSSMDSGDFLSDPKQAPGAAGENGSLRDGNGPARERRPMRVGTIVWGLVLISLASLLLAVRVADVRLDAGLVALGLTIGAGTALVVGGLLTAVNRRS